MAGTGIWAQASAGLGPHAQSSMACCTAHTLSPSRLRHVRPVHGCTLQRDAAARPFGTSMPRAPRAKACRQRSGQRLAVVAGTVVRGTPRERRHAALPRCWGFRGWRRGFTRACAPPGAGRAGAGGGRDRRRGPAAHRQAPRGVRLAQLLAGTGITAARPPARAPRAAGRRPGPGQAEIWAPHVTARHARLQAGRSIRSGSS